MHLKLIITSICFLILAMLGSQPVEAATNFFSVKSIEDIGDQNLMDGICNAGNGKCTLRAAIDQGNATEEMSEVVIELDPGDYYLTGAGEEVENKSGDLNIKRPMTIRASHFGEVTIHGSGEDRVFHILSNGEVVLENLIVRDGILPKYSKDYTYGGGGIYLGKGSLDVKSCWITANKASGVSMRNGGGFFSADGTSLSIFNSAITDNSSKFTGAGIYSHGKFLSLEKVVISKNIGAASVAVDGTGELRISNSSIVFNEDGLSGFVTDKIVINNTVAAGNIEGDIFYLCAPIGDEMSYILAGEAYPCEEFPAIETNVFGTKEYPLPTLLGDLVIRPGIMPYHPLLAGNFGINAGPKDGCGEVDISGNPRPIGGRCDIGAFESKCGDGKVDEFEECDDGNLNENDTCVRCMIVRFCGDGIVNNKETCDDGNLVSGDGCSSSCRIEEGFRPNENQTSVGSCSLSSYAVNPHIQQVGGFAFLLLTLVLWRIRKKTNVEIT